ncbi:GntR family transcriptional regulator (plasmid) [Rhizobium leguminosarum]|uniref:GntR family transcriptional regulator n=1 Tax=Rhizobium leguminosarum TaxID=384 RepID=UPI0004867C7D|nr:GntR family transcriptional regulator [Rhizobium leguminosarum]UIK01206.1 GntR family transcriptional regulator [Rhizobium leguminosarum]UIK14121.1 GntR family transcriptional regulator [Rhizobium leguminosarum]UIL30253.1 GntR family transcriptional regulator [Rhizobium leguminosarum]UIL30295.1 GntR family transcriptional regulator [Rhizobium leguminosarum]WFT90893.1 GntR family transcriptional regulator [Rhizobium leguminosarum]
MADAIDTGPRQQTLKALQGLRDIVLKGEVEAGERLSEVALSTRLDVSRTPLRTALQRLEQEGLVEAIASGGFAVRRFSRNDVIDAIELRGVLEGTAARLAAERGAPSAGLRQLAGVVAALDAVVAPGPENLDFGRYEELNGDFHATLAALSGSDIIRREIARVTGLPFASPNAFVNDQVDIPAFRQSLLLGQVQHKAILSAIEGREGTRAEALAREHARLARQNLDIVLFNTSQLRHRVAALALMAG